MGYIILTTDTYLLTTQLSFPHSWRGPAAWRIRIKPHLYDWHVLQSSVSVSKAMGAGREKMVYGRTEWTSRWEGRESTGLWLHWVHVSRHCKAGARWSSSNCFLRIVLALLAWRGTWGRGGRQASWRTPKLLATLPLSWLLGVCTRGD